MELFLISLGIFTYEAIYNPTLRDKLIAGGKSLIVKLKKSKSTDDTVTTDINS